MAEPQATSAVPEFATPPCPRGCRDSQESAGSLTGPVVAAKTRAHSPVALPRSTASGSERWRQGYTCISSALQLVKLQDSKVFKKRQTGWPLQQCCRKKLTWKLEAQLPKSGHPEAAGPLQFRRLQLIMWQAEALSSCKRPTMAHHSNVAFSMAAALLLFQLRARRYLSKVLWTHQAAR